MTAILVTLAGAACLVAAAWIAHPAAGLAVLGVLLLGFGLLADIGES